MPFGSRSFELAVIPGLEGQFLHDASRKPNPGGYILGVIMRPWLDMRRFADETPRRLCVRCGTHGNPLNNYPHSIRNHATSRLVIPNWSPDPLPSIRDIILFKPSLSIFQTYSGCIMLTNAIVPPISLRYIANAYRKHVVRHSGQRFNLHEWYRLTIYTAEI